MRTTILASAALVALAAATPAAAAYIYTPGASAATAEGNSNNVVFDQTNRHWQWIFKPAIFGSEALMLNAVAFRLDSIVISTDYTYQFGQNLRIKLNTLAGAPSTAYAANLVGAQTVLSGSRQVTRHAGAAGMTKPFDLNFVFDTPYLYRPDHGALVFDFIVPAQGVFGTLDFVRNNPLESRVFNFDPSAATGEIQAFGPVARFDVAAIPEPATWALMIAGFGGAGAALRRRRALAI